MACLNSHFQLSKSLEKLSKSGMHFIEKRNDLLYSRASNKHTDTTSDDLRGGGGGRGGTPYVPLLFVLRERRSL